MRDTMVDTEVITGCGAAWPAARHRCTTASRGVGWLEDDSLQLFVDKERVLYATDRSGREAMISCGAVLDHFRVAMAAAGWTANVDRFPNPNNHYHLASIDFSPMEFVTDGHRRRANAILKRRTDRLPFAEPPDWDSFESTLRNTITGDAERLDVIADELRPELGGGFGAHRITSALRFVVSCRTLLVDRGFRGR